MTALTDLPKDVTPVVSIIEKVLSSGILVEVYLVKTARQFEAALFIEGKYKAGPPVPRELVNPSISAAYWMGVRPKVGLNQEEGDSIFSAVNGENIAHHINFMDKWGGDYAESP